MSYSPETAALPHERWREGQGCDCRREGSEAQGGVWLKAIGGGQVEE